MKLAEQLELILDNRIAQDNLTLPMLPAIAARANDVVRRPDATVKDLVATVQLDPILAALVMRQAGSANCRTLEQAVAKLGAQKARSILAETSSHRAVESRDSKSAEATRLIWEHSRAVALIAQDVAVLAGVEEPEACYVTGLLHDIGKPVVAIMLLEAEAQIAQRNPKLWIDGEAWIGVVDRTYRKIGTNLTKKWQLAEEIQNATLAFSDYDVGNRKSVGNAVHFSNALVKQLGISVGEAGDYEALIMVGKSLLGIDDEAITRITDEIKARAKLS
jgi:HD-like signal output (HDOD) protein